MMNLSLRESRRRGLGAIVALLLVVLALAGCSSSGGSEFSLTGVNWQWDSWANSEGVNEVPDPANYTLTFNTDGTLNGKADCNNFAGTYTQENAGIQIMLGPTTLVACPEGSLSDLYLQQLGQVVAGGPTGDGGLALENGGGETRMEFSNPADAAAGSTMPLGLPWWAWLLLGAVLLGLLYFLMRGNKNATPTAREVERAAAAAPAAPAAPTRAAAPVAATATPAPAKPDDLTKIEGIGPKISSVLIAAGITTFRKLADAPLDELQSILNTADIHGSFGDPTTWGAQASLAAAGDWDALASLQESLKGGRVG